MKLDNIPGGFKLQELENGVYQVHMYGKILKLLPYYARTTLLEANSVWEKYYLPPMSLRGKTVLDAGAGCGETAAFYLAHGASKVIAVETEESCCDLMRSNASENSMDVQILNCPFDEDVFLSQPFDFAKIDVEGAEKCLLTLDEVNKPCVLEVHDIDVRRAILAKFPDFRVLDGPQVNREHCLLANY